MNGKIRKPKARIIVGDLIRLRPNAYKYGQVTKDCQLEFGKCYKVLYISGDHPYPMLGVRKNPEYARIYWIGRGRVQKVVLPNNKGKKYSKADWQDYYGGPETSQ